MSKIRQTSSPNALPEHRRGRLSYLLPVGRLKPSLGKVRPEAGVPSAKVTDRLSQRFRTFDMQTIKGKPV